MDHSTMPLDQRDTIYVPRTDTNLVNFHFITETGQVPQGAVSENYSIDWNAKDPDGRPDAFNRAINSIEERSQQRIDRSSELQKLLHKDHWDFADREAWEKKVSEIVKDETAKTPGFKDYRTIDDPHNPGVTDIQRLNDLSSDLESNTEKKRFDCGIESLVKGSIMQRLEKQNLPSTAKPGDYRKASNYFLAAGDIDFKTGSGGHYYVVAPSGNLIEETASDRYTTAYKKVTTPNTLETYARGHGVVTTDGWVYGTGVINSPQSNSSNTKNATESATQAANDVRQLAEDVAKHRRENGVVRSEDSLRNDAKAIGYQVLEDQKNGLIMIAGKNPNQAGDYEVKVYQKQNVGTNAEGFAMVGYGHGSESPSGTHISVQYKDELDGNRQYKADANFNGQNIRMDIYEKTDKFEAPTRWQHLTHSEPPRGDGFERTAGQSFTGSPTPAAADNTIPNADKPAAPEKQSSPVKIADADGSAQTEKIKVIQEELKRQNLYNGPVDGVWGARTNRAFSNFLEQAQETGKANQTYAGNVDRLYGSLTHEALLERHDIGAEFTAAVEAMRLDGSLQELYRRPNGSERTITSNSETRPGAVDLENTFDKAVSPGAFQPAAQPAYKPAQPRAAAYGAPASQ